MSPKTARKVVEPLRYQSIPLINQTEFHLDFIVLHLFYTQLAL